MKHFIRIWQGVEHKVLGSKDDKKTCNKCKIEFNQRNFQIASTKINPQTQIVYKRLKNKCKNCENPLRTVRHNLGKHPTTPPKLDYCEHCFKSDTKIVLHHNHFTEKFVRWACINCNSRFVHDTFEEHIKDAERWYQE